MHWARVFVGGHTVDLMPGERKTVGSVHFSCQETPGWEVSGATPLLVLCSEMPYGWQIHDSEAVGAET